METIEFAVSRNHEDQYALFPACRQVPAGWSEAGFRGSEEECIAYVDTIWTDMRPRSVRRALGEQ